MNGLNNEKNPALNWSDIDKGKPARELSEFKLRDLEKFAWQKAVNLGDQSTITTAVLTEQIRRLTIRISWVSVILGLLSIVIALYKK